MTTSTAVSPDARHLWRRGRGLLLAAVALAVTGLLIALLTSGPSSALDPRSATPTGSRAIAQLLADRGIDTTVVTTAAEAADLAGPDTTLLVTNPEALTPHTRGLLRSATTDAGGRTVLVSPGPATLADLAPEAGVDTIPAPVEERQADCAWPPAERAGSAQLGGYRYRVPADATGCYVAGGLPTLALLPGATAEAGETVLLGSPHPLHNEHLDEYGNAALALQLLGTRQHLVWYLPSAEEAPAAEDQRGLLGLLHPGWRWATLQLLVAAGLAALWRARRLGRVVTERLPVVVHAAETTEGRARLYHQAGARDRAADALRAATRSRLAPLVGVPPTAAHSPEALPAAVAAHTGEHPATVHQTLFGPAPTDDQALVRLADELDALERRLTPHRPTEPDRKGPTP